MFYSSIVWRFLGLAQRQRFHVKNWPVWVGVTMLNVDALWREGGAAGPAPAYARGVSTGPLAPMVVAVTTAGGALEAGISYRTGAFEEGTADRIAAEARAVSDRAGPIGGGRHGRIAVLPVLGRQRLPEAKAGGARVPTSWQAH